MPIHRKKAASNKLNTNAVSQNQRLLRTEEQKALARKMIQTARETADRAIQMRKETRPLQLP